MEDLDYGMMLGIICGIGLVFTIIMGINIVFGESSYMKGNNTIANVTAIHDMNDEKLYGKDNPMRLVHPNTYEWSNEDIQCKLYGNDCDIDTITEQNTIKVIEIR